MNWLYQKAVYDTHQTAVYYKGTTLTYGELYDTASRWTKNIHRLNRTRIAVYMDNSLDAVILIHAFMQSGVEMVCINTRLTKHEIQAQLADIDVDTVISVTDIELDGVNVVPVQTVKKATAGTTPVHHPKPDDILSVMFTSGTTGTPKAVAQTYLNHQASAEGCKERFPYDRTSRWLLVNPIYHISGLSIVFRTVMSGAVLYIADTFDEAMIIDMIQSHHITHTSLVPVMLKRLMYTEWDHELEGILLGGAGATRNLMSDAIDRGLPIHNSFGMTETCSQIVSVSYQNPKILNGSVGRPPENVDIKVDDNNELLVKADNVTPGYLNAEIKFEDGYFRTGDLAEIDAAGYLYILDRRKDLIISGGENIYPKEIEDAVNEVAGVTQSVVIKKKDEHWGEVPVLLVAGSASIESIDSHLKTTLARYKQPKEIHRVKSVYMTSTGKVSREKNKALFEQIQTKY